jgi:hypothetical protein
MAREGARRRSSSVLRGSEGRKRAEQELERSKERAKQRREQGNMPFRFRVQEGDTTQFVVLDDEPDFFRFEHNLKDPQTGRWSIFTGCVAEFDNCPVCQASGRDSYYAMYLTVLDLTPFKTKDGEKVEFSRKLLVVKPAQQKKFIRAYNKAEQEGRTLRGAIFETSRDTDKDSAIGNDIEFVEFMEEEELSTFKRSWKDREGKKQSEDCSEVYDYDKLFPETTTEELRQMVGAGPAFGSREEEEENLGTRRSKRRAKDDDDDDDYERPALNKRTKKAKDEDDDEDDDRPTRGRSRRRDAEEEEEKPSRSKRRARDDADEEEEEEEKPRRSSRRARDEDDEKPSRSRRASKSDDDDDDGDDSPWDDDDDDAPPKGRKAPGVGRRVTARGRR